MNNATRGFVAAKIQQGKALSTGVNKPFYPNGFPKAGPAKLAGSRNRPTSNTKTG